MTYFQFCDSVAAAVTGHYHVTFVVLLLLLKHCVVTASEYATFNFSLYIYLLKLTLLCWFVNFACEVAFEYEGNADQWCSCCCFHCVCVDQFAASE